MKQESDGQDTRKSDKTEPDNIFSHIECQGDCEELRIEKKRHLAT